MAQLLDAALAAANILPDSITLQQRATLVAAFSSGKVDVQHHCKPAAGTIQDSLILTAGRGNGHVAPIIRAPASFKTGPARYKAMKHGAIAFARYEEYGPKPGQLDQGKKRHSDRYFYVLRDGTVARGFENIPDNAPVSPSWDPNNAQLPEGSVGLQGPQLSHPEGRAAAGPSAAAAGETEPAELLEELEPAPAGQAPAPASGTASTAPVGVDNAEPADLKDAFEKAKQAMRGLSDALTTGCARLKEEHRTLQGETEELKGVKAQLDADIVRLQGAKAELEGKVAKLRKEREEVFARLMRACDQLNPAVDDSPHAKRSRA